MIILALPVVILTAVWPFIHWLKFPYHMPLLALVFTILACAVYREPAAAGFTIMRPAGRLLSFIVAAFIVTELLFDLLLQPLISFLFNEPADYSGFRVLQDNSPLLLKYFFYTWLSAAIAEEIIYRAMLFWVLTKSGLPALVVTCIQALLFASAHFYQGWSGMAITFLFGMAFGLLYIKSGRSIITVILVHGLIDSLFILLAYAGCLQWYENPFSILF